MARRRAGRPSAKMVRLYHTFAERFGGEPADLWTYDPAALGDPPPFVRYKQVMVWPADDDCDVATFVSLGMSDHRMTGADYFAEIHFAVRAYLHKAAREEVARYVANLTAYPFQYGLKLDWWGVMRDPGEIPCFPNCRHLLLRDRLTGEGFDSIDDPDGSVKLLYAVPITPPERHLLLDHGRGALEDYWAGEGIDLLADRDQPPGEPGDGSGATS